MTDMKQHSQALKVYPQTSTPFYTSGWQFVVSTVYNKQYNELDSSAYAMEWAVKTGRLPSALVAKLEKMRPYQVLKLLVAMAVFANIESQKVKLVDLLS
jgi:hypothetical protein